MTTTERALDWPGRSETGSVILPLMAAPSLEQLGTLSLPESAFLPKRELHITLLSTSEAVNVAAVLPEPHWQTIFRSLRWSVHFSGRAFLLGKDKPTGQAWSVIAELRGVPINEFRKALSKASGVALPDTLPHVTLWVAGGERGIGLSSLEEFRQRVIREIPLGSLLPDKDLDIAGPEAHPTLQGEQP
jgi:hypothetical protein